MAIGDSYEVPELSAECDLHARILELEAKYALALKANVADAKHISELEAEVEETEEALRLSINETEAAEVEVERLRMERDYLLPIANEHHRQIAMADAQREAAEAKRGVEIVEGG